MKVALIYFLLASVIVGFVTYSSMGISFDSKRYILVGEYFERGAWDTGIGVLFPHHPPLYPLAIAGVSTVFTGNKIANDLLRFDSTHGFQQVTRRLETTDSKYVTACRLISILGFGVLVMAMFLLAKSLGGLASAHLAGILALLFYPFPKTFFWCWSEAIYVPLSVLFFLTLLAYVKNKEKIGLVFLLTSAVLAAMGFLTRFMGISLVITGAFVVLLHSRNLIKVTLWTIIAGSPVLLYLGLNRLTAPSEFSFFEQCGKFLLVLHRDLGALLLLGSSVLLFRYRTKLFKINNGITVYMILYSLMLLAISSVIWFDPLDTRLLLPLYPFILVGVAVGLSKVFEDFGFSIRKLIA